MSGEVWAEVVIRQPDGSGRLISGGSGEGGFIMIELGSGRIELKSVDFYRNLDDDEVTTELE